MRTFFEDLGYAYRNLKHRPGLVATCILTLALATGANISIFSIFYAVLVRPLLYSHADELYVIWEDASRYGFPQNSPAPANYLDWKKQSTSFAGMSAYTTEHLVLTGDAEPLQVLGASASDDIFSVLGLSQAETGRLLNKADDVSGAPKTCVLSYRLWQSRFSGDRSIAGKTIRLDGASVVVAGVLPRNFVLPFEEVDLIIPFAWDAETQNDRGNHYLYVLGRLKSGVKESQALQELKLISSRLESAYPETNTNLGVGIVKLRNQMTGDFRVALWALLAAVSLVLLIACANLAGLQLSNAMDRLKEMSLRAALGATRFRIGRMLLCESLILAVAGGAVGLMISGWFAKGVSGLLPQDLLGATPIHLDGFVLLFAVSLSLLSGILSGIVPAWQLGRHGLSQTLKEGSSRLSGGRNRIRSVFVTGEIALCVCLVIAAGLMVRSLQRVMSVSLGFNPAHTLTLRTTLSPDPYEDYAKRTQFYAKVLQNVRSLDGVAAAGYTSHLPLSWSGDNNQFVVEGAPIPPAGSENIASVRVISPEYFRAIGAGIVRGRDFTEQDRLDSPLVAIINESLANKYWPAGDAVGKRIQRGNQVTPNGWLTVIGVVPDAHQSNVETATRPEIYLSYLQRKPFYFAPQDLVIRVQGDAIQYAGSVRRIIAEADKNQPVSNVFTMEEVVRKSSSGRFTQSALFGAFGLVAVLLASLGIYGVITNMVVRRTPEIGIRMVMGARRSQLIALVLKPALSMTLAGITIGLIASYGLSRILQSLLFGVSATDPTTFLVVPLMLAAIAILACILPLRRATTIDPAVALRAE